MVLHHLEILKFNFLKMPFLDLLQFCIPSTIYEPNGSGKPESKRQEEEEFSE